MKTLFDQGTPVPLRRALAGHTVSTAHEMGWAALDNGALLDAAEAAFDACITTDRNLRHQQNLTGRRLAVMVLPPPSWPNIRPDACRITTAIDALRPGVIVGLA